MLSLVKLVNMHLGKLVWKLLCSLLEWENCFKVLSISLIWGMFCFHVILTAFTKTNTGLMNRIFRDAVCTQSPVALKEICLFGKADAVDTTSCFRG